MRIDELPRSDNIEDRRGRGGGFRMPGGRGGGIGIGTILVLGLIGWNAPNMALVEVLLPDSATPIHPRMGATTMNHGPIVEKPLASELPMPE
jgi:predicted metalloprotease